MPNDGSNGWGTVLPSLAPQLGELMQQDIAYGRHQQQQSHNQQLQEQHRQEQQQQQNRMYNIRQIDAETDAAKYQTGEQQFDNYANNELKRIGDKAFSEYSSLDPAEMQMRLGRDMGEFLKWHSTAKDQIKQINQGLQEFNKTYPNVDAIKAHEMVFGKFAQDFLQQNPNTGQMQRKPVEFIKPQNYIEQLQQPEVLGSLVNDESQLSKYYHSLPKNIVSDTDYAKNSKGGSSKTKWTAPLTDATMLQSDEKGNLVYDKDGKPIIDVKHQAVKVGGNTIKLIDEKVLNDMPPAAKAALSARWLRAKPSMEAKMGTKIEGDLEPMMFRAFAHQDAFNSLPNKATFAAATVQPRVIVNTGSGRSSGNTQMNDVYNEVAGHLVSATDVPVNKLGGTAQVSILDYARKLSGNQALSNKKLSLHKGDDGQIHMIYTRSTGESEDIGSLDYKDINLSANKGLGQKVKQKVIANGNSGNSKPASKGKLKTIEGF